MNLSPNFTLAELTASETAARRGIDNTPREPFVMDNLKRTAGVLEEIRSLLAAPILVTSGYRCLDLNSAIGSKPTSAHVVGLAADFHAPRFGTPFEICRAIEPHVRRLGIDQLIHEHTWVHVGLRAGEPRHQLLTLAPGGRYLAGIVQQGMAA